MTAQSPNAGSASASPLAPPAPLDAKVLHAAIRVASHDVKNAIGIIFLQLELAAKFTTTDPAQVLELLASIREESRAVVTCIETLNAAVPPVSIVTPAGNHALTPHPVTPPTITPARTPPESPR